MTEKQAQNRSRLREEERRVHRLQKEQVSLVSALGDKQAEMEGLRRTADPQQLEEMRTELTAVEQKRKESKNEVASHRKKLNSLQENQEKAQEVLEALQRRLVCISHPS